MSPPSDSGERRTFGSLRLRGRIWWARFRVDGKERWESLGTSSQTVAEKKLAVIEDRFGRGEHLASDARRLSFADLETIVRTDYRLKGNRSAKRLEVALSQLRTAFGGMRAVAITSERITEFEVARLDAGASRSTVNYELAMLRRAFRLAVKARRLPSAPAISTPDPKNARVGFFEAEDFKAVLTQLPDHLQPVMRFAYFTGWRVRSEVLPLTWDRIDFAAGVVRLDANTTKNGKGRTFPFGALPGLAALLKIQRAATDVLQRETNTIIPYVFHRRGRPLKSYTRAWVRACALAARDGKSGKLAVVTRPQLEGRMVHDFRRTAVRNLVRAGVPDGVAMRLTGHLTRSVFDRYNVTSDADLRAGVSQLSDYLEGAGARRTRPAKTPKAAHKGAIGGQRRPIRMDTENEATA